jgi:hypothetical protein
MGTKEDITDVLSRLLPEIQGVKLGPGVVGRNSSIAWALEFVMLAGVIAGAYLHSVWLVGISLLGAIGAGLFFARKNVEFGKDNPAAAVLEGIQFLQFHQMQAMAMKGDARVVELPFSPPVQPPVSLPGEQKKQLDSPESDS